MKGVFTVISLLLVFAVWVMCVYYALTSEPIYALAGFLAAVASGASWTAAHRCAP